MSEFIGTKCFTRNFIAGVSGDTTVYIQSNENGEIWLITRRNGRRIKQKQIAEVNFNDKN